MSKATAALTRKNFAPKVEKTESGIAFQPAQRADGVLAHNMDWAESDGCLYIRIDMRKEAILSSNGKPMVCTSRGFITIGSAAKVALNLNGMKR
mgnify:CR=1 FL=1